MLEKSFNQVYEKFKLNFYKNIFKNFEDREASLTSSETISVEVIYALNRPTVSEYANFLNISHPNAAYKISSLVRKGYIQKIRSKNDRREFHLEVTDKFHAYNDLKNSYIVTVMERIHEHFSKEDVEKLEKILQAISSELMPEISSAVAGRELR
ncbi:MAG: winged helix-turn-helix transcriptional regulator [Tissierellia bacterium]|nr:winged helix-turn-helix transcriptional regulator [Tissierellia bacterium]